MTATLGALALVATGLGVASAFRGPQLEEGAVAAADTVRSADQRLVLRADQLLDPVTADDVAIEPAAPIDVSSEGAEITVRFTGMLDAATEYRVAVDVTAAATGVASRLEYRFATPDLALAFLATGPAGSTEVRRASIPAGGDDQVFAADGIVEFAELSYGVVALLADDRGIPTRVVIAPEGESAVQEIALPDVGRVTDLHAASRSDLVGFVFTSLDQRSEDALLSQLLLFDPLDPSGLPRPVTGLDGQPVSVLDWTFVPGTPYLVAQTFEQVLLLVDTTTDAPPVPLGEHAELRGFVPGTVELVVADPLSGSTIDLADGTTTTLELPSDGRPESDYRGALVLLDTGSYLEVVSRPSGESGFVLDFEVLAVSGDGVRVIADPEPGTFVRGLCLSPNAQYVAVQFVRGNTDFSLAIIDLASGETVTLAGTAPSWCR